MQFFALTLLSGSFDMGSSMENVLQWENAVRGMESVLPLLRDAAMMIVFCWVAVLLPMSVFRTMHPLIARSLRFSSLLVGGVCWWQAVIVTYRLLGWLPVVTGLLFGGVGVIPMALMATASKQNWFVFGDLIATAALTILARLISREVLPIATPGKKTQRGIFTTTYTSKRSTAGHSFGTHAPRGPSFITAEVRDKRNPRLPPLFPAEGNSYHIE